MTDTIGSGYRPGLPPDKWVNNPMSRTVTVQKRVDESGRIITCAPNANGQYLAAKLEGDILSYFAGVSMLPAVVTSEETNAIARANIDVLNRIETPSSQSLVTAAEFGKTVSLIRSRAQLLEKVILLCKAGNVRKLEQMFPHISRRTLHRHDAPGRVIQWDSTGVPILGRNGKPVRGIKGYTWVENSIPFRERLDEAGKLWLEYRYGWRPLVFDMVDTLKAWHAGQLREQLAKRDLKRVSSRSVYETPVKSSYVVSNSLRNWTIYKEELKRCEARCYVYYEVDKTWGQNLQRLNDFGVFDVPRAAWELVPWSFVADWFVPIGDWLGALTPKVGVNIVTSGTTYLTERSVKRTVTNYTYSGSTTATGDNFSAAGSLISLGKTEEVAEYKLVRTTGVGVPILPPVDVKMGFNRFMDAFALLRGSTKANLRI